MQNAKASRTALVVAAATLLARARGLKPAPSDRDVIHVRRWLGLDPFGARLVRLVDSPILRPIASLAEWLLAPGIAHHFCRRKAWVRGQWLEARRGGCDNVLILGAGLDPLGTCLATEEGGPLVVEIDHPATAALKGLSTDQPGPTRIAGNLVHQPLAELFGGVNWRPGPIFVLAEGLLMYFKSEDVDALVGQVAQLPAPEVHLAFTFMQTDRGNRPTFRSRRLMSRAWLRWVGEPFAWGAPQPQVRELLQGHGFEVVDMVGEHELARRWPGRILEGETCVRAVRGAM